MRLKSYYDFLIESVLFTSEYLLDIIKSIDDPISQKFYPLVNTDIKTKFNILDLTDVNNKISFIPDSQVNTKIKAGINPDDLFKEKGNETTVGRVIKGILTDNNIPYTDREVEKFVNSFKAAWDRHQIKSKKIDPIRIVKGEDIRYWYSMNNYCPEAVAGKGSLGKSCMRNPKDAEFFDIYVNNPDQVGMVIYVDDNNKLRTRAIFWQTDSGPYLDRIYYTDDSEVNLITTWITEKFTLTKKNYKKVELTGKSNPDGTFNFYPYMDTFMYYNISNKTLYSDEPSRVDRKSLFELQDTCGGAHNLDTVYCEYEDAEYPSDEVVYSERYGSWMSRDNAVYSENLGDYIWMEDSVYSNILRDHLPQDEVRLVYLDINKKKSDYYLNQDNDDIFHDVDSGDYYLMTLTDLDDDGIRCVESNILKVCLVDPSSIDEYKKIYNIDTFKGDLYTNPVDKIFGISFDVNKSKNIYNLGFFKTNYNMMLTLKMDKMLTDLNLSHSESSKKSEEISLVDERLDKPKSLFRSRNQIYKLGIDKFISLWKNKLSEVTYSNVWVSRNVTSSRVSIFDKIFDNILKSRIEYNAEFRSWVEKTEVDKTKLNTTIRELLEDPRDFMLGFQQCQSEINKDLQKSIVDRISKDYGSESVEMIVDLTNRVYRKIIDESKWNSYEGINWSTSLDLYLINQVLFRDIIKQ